MRKWSIYIIALLLLSACTADESLVDPNMSGQNGDNSEMTLSLKFPKSSPTTYAFTATDENRIQTLDIFVFTKGSGDMLTDKFAYSIQLPQSSITDSIGGESVNGSIKKVKVKVKSRTEEQRFVLIANKPSGLQLATTDTVAGQTTLGELIGKLKYHGLPWRKDNVGASDPAFPMWGQMTSYIKFHSTATPPAPSRIDINMIRSVARIDIGVDINGTGDPALGFGSIFKIENVYLCNASGSGYIAPHNDYLMTATGAGKTLVERPNVTTDRISNTEYTFNPNEGRSMVRSIYTPESDTLKGTYTPAFIVIKARYYDNTYYYRIDFAKDGKYQALLRNNSYLINITGVRTNGYGSLNDALKAPVSKLNYSLTLGDSNADINEVITNENYMLGYSASNIKIDWDDQINIPVLTDYPEGWKATGSITASGVTGSGTITSTLLPKNTTGIPITHIIQLSAGTLTKEIKVTQSAGSNSYIVTGNSIEIPVLSANTGGENRITAGESLETRVEWAEGTIGSNIQTSYDPGTTILKVTGITGTGNVLIYALTGGCRKFTWHLWVTDQDPTAIQRSNNGFIFMDRNLGADSQDDGGLYYQWGRKEPFTQKSTNFDYEWIPGPGSCSWGGGGAVGGGTLPTGNFLEDAINLPKSFFIREISPFDWAASDIQYQNNNYWITADGEKGPYDPCPFGWRVPPVENSANSPWSGFTNSTRYGIKFPLAGGKDMTSGLLVGENSQGYLWGASARGTQAFVFEFTNASGSANETQAFRANGYPVRCVKDTKR